MYKYIKLNIEYRKATLSLNRPLIHNAFHENMILEIINAIDIVNKSPSVVVLIIRGEGKSFCAGADLNWMKSVIDYSHLQNVEESNRLSACFYALYTCKKVTIAIVHGAAIGGANGLLATCDIVIADNDTVFSLSEVKIGIVPACISPYIIKRVGEFKARELMLSGVRFTGEMAMSYGLVTQSVAKDKIDDTLNRYILMLSTSGPKAMEMCKSLIYEVSNNLNVEESMSYTAEIIAYIRHSKEGQEGMKAFLEKRKPNWTDD